MLPFVSISEEGKTPGLNLGWKIDSCSHHLMVTIIPSVKSKDPTSCSIVQGEKCPTSLDSHSFPTRASFPPHILCKVLRVTRFPSGFHGEELGSSLLFQILTSAGSVSLYPSFLRTPLSSLSWGSFFSLFFFQIQIQHKLNFTSTSWGKVDQANRTMA